MDIPSQTQAAHHAIRADGWRAELKKFWLLLFALVVRDFKGQYRRSILGPSWAILQPVAYMAIFLFIRSILNIPSDGMPYILFTYSALVPWTFFSNGVMRCGPSILTNRPILRKMALVREVFPLAAVLNSFVDLAISSTLLIGMMIWYGIAVTWVVFWLPVLVMIAALLALGVGLGAAAIGTYRRDIIFAIPFLLQFWMLGTPIMYPLSRVPSHWKAYYSINPMVGVIEGFRRVLVKGVPPDLDLLLPSLIGLTVVWLVAWPLFRYTSQYFADVL